MDPDAAQKRQQQWMWAIIASITLISGCKHVNNPKQNPSFQSKAETAVELQKTRKKKYNKKSKPIYLTFDDGPNKGSRTVLNIINEERVPATFFIVGEHINGTKWQKALFDSIVASPFVYIANHSYAHANNQYGKYYSQPDSVAADFVRCADSLRSSNTFVRLPGRNTWRLGHINYTDIGSTSVAADTLAARGMQIMGWDAEWHFDSQGNLKENYESISAVVDSVFAKQQVKTKQHLVLLAHDQSFADRKDSAELHHFIRALKAKEDVAIDFISNYPIDGKKKPH